MTSPLDPDAVTALRASVGGDDEFLAELVTTFLDEAPAQLAALEAAAGNGDAAGLRLVAHTLKANAATFGIRELEAVCRELEGRARGENLAGADTLVAAVRQAMANAQPALETLTTNEVTP